MKKLLMGIALCLAFLGNCFVVADNMAIKVILEGQTLIDDEFPFLLNEAQRTAVSETDGTIYTFWFKVTEDEKAHDDESVIIYATLTKQNVGGKLEIIASPVISASWNDQASIQMSNTSGENTAIILEPKR